MTQADHEDKFERIEEVAMTVREPRNAGEIAEMAGVARNTAEKYLQHIVELNKISEIQNGRETLYRPDPVTQYFDQVRELIEEYSKQELTDELVSIREDIDEWRDSYGVSSPDELRASIGDQDLSGEEARERRRLAEDWEYYRQRAEMIKHAVSMYTSVEKTKDEKVSV
ncbi:ArsR family transcriptional regulator [Halorutilales archaeon Cl-col2-1]